MQISKNGIELIKHFEGLRLEAYKCPAGVWTIGYGHTNNVHRGDRVTKQEAEEMLVKDLVRFEKGVNDAVRVPIYQGQFDALVSFSYNMGLSAFRKSTLNVYLNKGEYDKAREELKVWVRGGGQVLPGLVRRREAEYRIWNAEEWR